MTIGDLAKSAGVSVETIRYYQRVELLSEPSKPLTGFRQYDENALERLFFIRKSKELGFSLSDVRELLSLKEREGSCADVCTLAKSKLSTVRQKISELQTLEGQLSQLITDCEEAPDCMILKALSQVD